MSIGWIAMLLAGLGMTSPTTATLVVDQTWDGERLEAPVATVSLTPTLESLLLEVEARYHGDPRPPGPPGSTDRLWQFEVVEVFLAGPSADDGRVPYTEIELGPHGHYLVLRFAGVRAVVETGRAIELEAEIRGDRWHGVALVPWSYLPAGRLAGNAYAIHGVADERRYLAAEPVPGPAPDFHQPSRFRPLGLQSPPGPGDLR